MRLRFRAADVSSLRCIALRGLLCCFFTLIASAVLSGCGGAGNLPSSRAAVVPAGRQGVVDGGQEPVSGAMVQLYAVGAVGDGSAAMPLLSPAVVTGADGGFNLTGLYTCPSASALVYLVATGGNPGLGGTVNNADLALIAALGQCGNLTNSTYIVINELTTVATVDALAPFMTSASAVGSATGDAPALMNAFTVAAELVNTSTGTAPGTGVPAGTTVPMAQINTLGNILAACVNTTGGILGDSSACGQLLSLTALSGATTTPTDTITALLSLAKNPGLNTVALYSLAATNGPFQPADVLTPPDLAVRLASPGGLTISTTMLSFPDTRMWGTSPAQTISFTNNTATPIGIDLPVTVAIGGADPGDFQNAGGALYSCITPIMPGATCTVSLDFAPKTATGARSAYLIVNNTSANPVIGIPLMGNALEANAGPAYLSGLVTNLTVAGTPTNMTLTNSGASPLTVDSIVIGNDPTSGQPAFTETDNCVGTVAAHSSCMIGVSALSTTQLYSTGVLTVNDDSSSGPQTLSLSYSNGFSGPVLIDFGSRSIGVQEAGADNEIGGPLNQTLNFSVGGPAAADYSISGLASCEITRQSPTCGVAINFTPTALGERIASLLINGNPYGGLIGVGLPTGVQFGIYSLYAYLNTRTASSVSFSPVNVGQSSAATTLTIVNTGTVAMTLNAPAVSGPNASDFAVTSQCTTSIVPGGYCKIAVTAAPTQPTLRTATLTLTDSTSAAEQILPLSVLGLNAAPTASLNTLSFYSTPVGTVSASQSFNVTSNNDDPVRVTIQDGAYLPFVLTGASSCAQTPCQIQVAFAPTQAVGSSGTSYANVLVEDLFSGKGAVVNLSGTTQPPAPVYSLDVSPTSLTFAAQTVGTQSAAQSITVTNTGNQTATFSLSTTGITDYVIVNGCGATIAVGTNCSVSVAFKPTAVGSLPGSVPFTSNAYFFGSGSSPYFIPFAGTGQ